MAMAGSALRIWTSPKSSTLTKSKSRPIRHTKMLAGLTSRCTSPRSWASASEWHTCCSRYIARSGGMGPNSRTSDSRSRPISNSIT